MAFRPPSATASSTGGDRREPWNPTRQGGLRIVSAIGPMASRPRWGGLRQAQVVNLLYGYFGSFFSLKIPPLKSEAVMFSDHTGSLTVAPLPGILGMEPIMALLKPVTPGHTA